MDEKTEPTQTTPQGLEIPVPKSKDFFDNLKRTAPKVEPPDEDSTSDGPE